MGKESPHHNTFMVFFEYEISDDISPPGDTVCRSDPEVRYGEKFPKIIKLEIKPSSDNEI